MNPEIVIKKKLNLFFNIMIKKERKTGRRKKNWGEGKGSGRKDESRDRENQKHNFRIAQKQERK